MKYTSVKRKLIILLITITFSIVILSVLWIKTDIENSRLIERTQKLNLASNYLNSAGKSRSLFLLKESFDKKFYQQDPSKVNNQIINSELDSMIVILKILQKKYEHSDLNECLRNVVDNAININENFKNFQINIYHIGYQNYGLHGHLNYYIKSIKQLDKIYNNAILNRIQHFTINYNSYINPCYSDSIVKEINNYQNFVKSSNSKDKNTVIELINNFKTDYNRIKEKERICGINCSEGHLPNIDKYTSILQKNLNLAINISHQEYERKTKHNFSFFLFIAILLLIFNILLIKNIIVKFSNPIHIISNKIKTLINSDFKSSLNLSEYRNRKDEIGILSTNSEILVDMLERRNIQLNLNKIDLEKSHDNLKNIGIIGQEIISNLKIEQIVESVKNNLVKLIPLDNISIKIYNKQQKNLEYYSTDTISNKLIHGYNRVTDKNSLSIRSLKTQKEIIISNYDEQYKKFLHIDNQDFNKDNFQSLIYEPLIVGDEVIGVLSIKSIAKNAFNNIQITSARTLSVYIAIAVQNALTYDQLIENQQNVINQNEELIFRSMEIEKINYALQSKSELLNQTLEELKNKNLQIESYNKELERLSLVADRTDNFVIITNENLEIEWINKSFENLLGLNFEQYIEKFGKYVVTEYFAQDTKDYVQKSLNSRSSVQYLGQLEDKYGNKHWLQATLTPIFNNDGTLHKLIIIDTDITKIKEAENKIERQNRKITESLVYASKIQSAILTSKSLLDNILGEYFLLFRPRDIVSGDFYWANKIDNKIFVIVGDCTGHGIPGAFMSIMGISMINEITYKNSLLDAASIIDNMRSMLVKNFQQKNINSRDGMELALIIYDTDNQVIDYAGANIPLYIVKSRQEVEESKSPNTTIGIDNQQLNIIENSDRYLIEVKADRQSICNSNKFGQTFTNKKINISKGDIIYLGSDGYQNQIGGKNSRKILCKSFKQLLLQISDLEMKNQKEFLDDYIESWMSVNGQNTYVQMDDMIVLGLKF